MDIVLRLVSRDDSCAGFSPHRLQPQRWVSWKDLRCAWITALTSQLMCFSLVKREAVMREKGFRSLAGPSTDQCSQSNARFVHYWLYRANWPSRTSFADPWIRCMTDLVRICKLILIVVVWKGDSLVASIFTIVLCERQLLIAFLFLLKCSINPCFLSKMTNQTYTVQTCIK